MWVARIEDKGKLNPGEVRIKGVDISKLYLVDLCMELEFALMLERVCFFRRRLSYDTMLIYRCFDGTELGHLLFGCS